MKKATAKTLRIVAAKNGVPERAMKRDWLKMSHREKGAYRPKLAKAAGK